VAGSAEGGVGGAHGGRELLRGRFSVDDAKPRSTLSSDNGFRLLLGLTSEAVRFPHLVQLSLRDNRIVDNPTRSEGRDDQCGKGSYPKGTAGKAVVAFIAAVAVFYFIGRESKFCDTKRWLSRSCC
jgi:hypothetical protein